MTIAEEKARVGREPFSYIEIDVDLCQLEYGVAPCAAVLGVTGTQPCFRTFPNCQDTENYSAGVKTYVFCGNVARIPTLGVAVFPFLRAVNTTPAKLAIGSGLGERAKVSVTLCDAPHHDRGVDPYVAQRAYNPAEQGTFWGKFISRNRYYLGRPLRVVTGYLTEDAKGAPVYDPDNFETRHYVIEKMDPPDSNGMVTITAKDILKIADDDRAQAPRPAKGRLLTAINDSVTSATLNPPGIGDLSYASSGVLRISEELMDFTRAGDALTLVRGQYNSTAEAHSLGDAVQECYVVGDSSTGGEQLQDIIYDLLINYANVPAEWIDKPAWDAEAAAYITRLFQTIIATPVGVKQLLNELCEQGPAYLWTDELNKRINFRALRPAASASVALNDDEHFVAGSLKSVDKDDKRISQVWMFFGQRKYTEPVDNPNNYKQLLPVVGNGEDVRRYGQPKVKKVFCRWINEFGRTFAEEIADSILQRYNETPKQITFALDPKDSDLLIGDLFVGTTRLAQDDNGNKRAITYQVIAALEKNRDQQGHRFEYEALEERYTPSETSGLRILTINNDTLDLNLREMHDLYYAAPTGPVEVTFTIQEGATVGSSSTSSPALDVGEWPDGSTITIYLRGRVQGRGGDGGSGGHFGSGVNHAGEPGNDGGDAIYTRIPITIDCSSGTPEIWAGGGGGGGGAIGLNGFLTGGGGGGGGGGSDPGNGGPGGNGESIYDGSPGSSGTSEAGGAGGLEHPSTTDAGFGGAGGGPALPGASGQNGDLGYNGGSGGQPGNAIDGVSFITFTDSSADIRGAEIN